MITYTESLEQVTAEQLDGFFAGWANPPSAETHLRLLEGSYRVALAIDTDAQQVVGFINAISDGVLSGFVPLLEVLPEYQGRGIGSELTRQLLESLSHLYSIDLVCDPDLQPFYERLGLGRHTAMIRRNYEHQARYDETAGGSQ